MLQDPILKLGPIEIYMYGLMIAVGILICFLVLFYYSKKMNITQSFVDFVFYNGIASIAIGFGAATLFQSVYNYIDALAKDPNATFKLGGMTFMGGLIGGATCFLVIYWIFRKKLKDKLTNMLTVIPCSILVAHAFGRIGCFFSGCCYGVPTDSFLGVQFPHLPDPVHPTMLYEAAFLFIMFGVCSFLLLKFKFRHNMTVYLISYGVFRFLLEYIRGDDRGALILGLQPSQFWSIPMVILGIAVYFLFTRKDKAVFPLKK